MGRGFRLPGATAPEPSDCAPGVGGHDSLCAVWTDPEFDRDQAAFYYARVLEQPSCRWSTHLCQSLGVDCSDPASVPTEYAGCCGSDLPTTIRERAWTSPIWYRPDQLRGTIRFRSPASVSDLVSLRLRLPERAYDALTAGDGSMDLQIWHDDSLLLDAHIAHVLTMPESPLALDVRVRKLAHRGLLALQRFRPLDLSAVADGSKFLRVVVRAGEYETHVRRWVRSATGLRALG